MGYVLEDEAEFYRLEKQAKQKNYNLEEEFRHLQIKPQARILDAGCGSGLVSRFLKDREPSSSITAIDYSDIRVAQAKKNNPPQYQDIQFEQADLNKLPYEDNSFDLVVSRFVYEYLPDPVATTKELRRVLKPGGRIYLVDLDGLFLNFWTNDQEFNQTLKDFSNKLEIDLYVGRKLSSYINLAGFKNVDWDVTLHKFKNETDINDEHFNNIERLKFGTETFAKYFKNKAAYDAFSEKYLAEMKINNKGNTLFFNKFSAWGVK